MSIRSAVCIRQLVALSLLAGSALPLMPAAAQVREQPIAFDSAGRVNVITPPLAARLGLRAPLWPVSGDYLDARLYSLGDSARAFVLVVRRPQDAVDRYPLDATARMELAAAVARGNEVARQQAGPDTNPTIISERVRGSFVLNQSLLGVLLFAPYAAAMTNDASLGFATYLLVAGGTFFMATDVAKSKPITRAQNHLAWNSSLRGSAATSLALFALGGEDMSGQAHAAALLAGGIAGDVLGFNLAKPMTDAEAHGTSHGSTVAALLTTGLLGTTGLMSTESRARAGTGVVLAAGAVGFPLGLRYVRRAPYRVTAGDVGTLISAELIGTAAASILIADDNVSEEAVFGALTAGYGLGLIGGDRWLVRKFDHTEAEARLLLLGTLAGGLIGTAFPVLGESDNARLYLVSATIGGILGAMLTENLNAPKLAGSERASRSNVIEPSSRISVRFSPSSILRAGFKQPGRHSILALTF